MFKVKREYDGKDAEVIDLATTEAVGKKAVEKLLKLESESISWEKDDAGRPFYVVDGVKYFIEPVKSR